MENRTTEITSPILIILAFAILYIVWGSTYYFIKIALEDFPPLFLGALRYSTAGLLMLVWAKIRGKKLFDKRSLWVSAIVGILLLTGGNGAVVIAEQTLPSAVVAILWSLIPVTFSIIDKANWRKNFHNKSTVLGLVMGFLGVYLLFSDQIESAVYNSGASLSLGGMGIVIVGTLFFAIGSLYAKNNPSGLASEANVAWQMLFAGGTLMFGSFGFHEFPKVHWAEIKNQSWFALAFLIIFGSIAAFSAYVWLLSKRPATQVNTYAYVNPVIAVLIGVLFADENMSLPQLGGLVAILGSVLLINLSKYGKKGSKGSEIVTPEKQLVIENVAATCNHVHAKCSVSSRP